MAIHSDEGDAMTITKVVDIACQPKAVFEALTLPDEIVRHFPLERVESDGRVGGAFLLHGRMGDEPFTDHGRITAFEPDRVFAYRYWSTNHGTERSEENELTVRYQLEVQDGRTRLVAEHGNIASDDYFAAMDGVWDMLLANLKANLEARAV